MRERPGDAHSDEVKRTAIHFFFVNFLAIIFAYSLYDEGMPWGLTTLAISMVTSAMFASSAAFSISGAVRKSEVALVAGFVGLAISLVSVILMMIQYVSEHSP